MHRFNLLSMCFITVTVLLCVCICVSPVHDAENSVKHNEQGELSVQQLVNASLPAQQQPVEAEEGGIGYFTGISDGHPETS